MPKLALSISPISIHALRKESDSADLTLKNLSFDFNPRSP